MNPTAASSFRGYPPLRKDAAEKTSLSDDDDDDDEEEEEEDGVGEEGKEAVPKDFRDKLKGDCCCCCCSCSCCCCVCVCESKSCLAE